MLELANILEILNKRATINHFKPLLLFLQNEVAKRNICLESEIDRPMDNFRLVIGENALIHRNMILILSRLIQEKLLL
jgi:hypothetical protein